MRPQRLVVDGPAGGAQRRIDRCRQVDELGLTHPYVEPQRPWPSCRRERPGATDRDVEGSPARAATRVASTADPIRSSSVGPRKRSVRCRLSRRTQRTSRPPPGTPSARTCSTSAAISDSASDGKGHRDEQAPSRQVGTRPAWATAGFGHPGRSCDLALPDIPVRRAGRRARDSRSRQPRTSTLLSSSAL